MTEIGSSILIGILTFPVWLLVGYGVLNLVKFIKYKVFLKRKSPQEIDVQSRDIQDLQNKVGQLISEANSMRDRMQSQENSREQLLTKIKKLKHDKTDQQESILEELRVIDLKYSELKNRVELIISI